MIENIRIHSLLSNEWLKKKRKKKGYYPRDVQKKVSRIKFFFFFLNAIGKLGIKLKMRK